MESCRRTIRFTTEFRNSDVVAEPPTSATVTNDDEHLSLFIITIPYHMNNQNSGQRYIGQDHHDILNSGHVVTRKLRSSRFFLTPNDSLNCYFLQVPILGQGYNRTSLANTRLNIRFV